MKAESRGDFCSTLNLRGGCYTREEIRTAKEPRAQEPVSCGCVLGLTKLRTLEAREKA